MASGKFIEPLLTHGTQPKHANWHARQPEAAKIFAPHHGLADLDIVVPKLMLKNCGDTLRQVRIVEQCGSALGYFDGWLRRAALAAAANALRRTASRNC